VRRRFLWLHKMRGKKRHLLVVRYLVEQGADKRKATNNGVIPIGAARLYGQDDVVAYLLSVGCTLGGQAFHSFQYPHRVIVSVQVTSHTSYLSSYPSSPSRPPFLSRHPCCK